MKPVASKKLIIAVDFDGTICENAWVEKDKPEVGNEIQGAVASLKRLQKRGHKLILWTGRTSNYGALAIAKNWCENRGLIFDAVNNNIEDGITGWPKVYADVYVDDHGLGLKNVRINWGVIFKRIVEIEDEEAEKINPEQVDGEVSDRT